MRALSANLLARQGDQTRKPASQVIIRDVMPRWSDLTTGAYNTDWPPWGIALVGTPQAPMDHAVESDVIYRAWQTGDTNIRWKQIPDPSSASDWETSSNNDDVTVDQVLARPGCHGNRLFYIVNDDLTYCDWGGSPSTLHADMCTGSEYRRYALAPVSNSVCYALSYDYDTSRHDVTIERHTSGAVDTCPFIIAGDSSFISSAITWFDAVTIGNRDVIVFTDRVYGCPWVVFYEDSVWSTPRQMLPQDIVDNYNFLLIGWMEVIQDGNSDDVIWATGRIGRGGTTGAHQQAYDIVLRSKDGEHWTADRYSYVGSDALRGKMLVAGDYVYYAGESTVKQSDKAWLVGGDPSGRKWTIDSDLLGWEYKQKVDAPSSGKTFLSDIAGDTYHPYKSGSTRYGIWPGYWIWRYAGYEHLGANELELISTEGIDHVPARTSAGTRTLSLRSRDSVYRSLVDWASDQDWQWLSQRKHYGDCDAYDELYPLLSPTFSVPDSDDAESTTTVEQDQLSTQSGSLEFQSYNQLGVFLCHAPYSAKYFTIAGRFQIAHDGGHTWMNGNGSRGSDSNWDTSTSVYELGTGFGVVGCVVNQWNYVAAYCDCRGGRLMLLQRAGTDDDDVDWYMLADADDLTMHVQTSHSYEVELSRRGMRFEAKVVEFQADGTRTVVASIEKRVDGTRSLTPHSTSLEYEHDRGRLGIICYLNVPESQVETVQANANYIARWHDLWSAGDDVEDSSPSDQYGYFKPDGTARTVPLAGSPPVHSEPLHLGDEDLALVDGTNSNKRSEKYALGEKQWDEDTDDQVWRQWLWNDDSQGTLGAVDWDGDGNFGHLFTVIENDQRGTCSVITSIENEVLYDRFKLGVGPASRDLDAENVHPYFIPKEEYDYLSKTGNKRGVETASQFMMLPGFQVTKTDGDPRGNSDQAVFHPASTVIRQHDSDRIVIREVFAYDSEHDKTLEWVLKDVASKAGIMDFETDHSVDDTITAVDSSCQYVQDVDSADIVQRDFDLTFTLPTTGVERDLLAVVFTSSKKTSLTALDFSSGDINAMDAVKIIYAYPQGETWTLSFYQTETGMTTWQLVDQTTYTDAAGDNNGLAGKRIRIVKRERFFTFYVNDRLVRSWAAAPITGVTDDGYASSLATGYGYVGLWADGIFWQDDIDITQPALYAWTDGIILDQKMNALAGLRRAIRDRRVKFLARQDGTLKMSTFDSRDTLPEVDGDLVYTDDIMYTDRIPTHTRVVSDEIAEYINHTFAAEYGMLYTMAQAPNLTEPEAYIEAQEITKDAVAMAEGRAETKSGDLDWEPEDEVPVAWDPHDGGPGVDDTFIVNDVTFEYRPGNFTTQATMRKKVT